MIRPPPSVLPPRRPSLSALKNCCCLNYLKEKVSGIVSMCRQLCPLPVRLEERSGLWLLIISDLDDLFLDAG